ncbi:MAG: hypothetical protein SGI86_01150 [Deltaproteobacteria bacterium]|nr:hypothetical protein [Deltaproteobacteria bacterium]
MSHFISKTAILGLLLLLACGDFTVTNERPTFAELTPPEQTVVDRVLTELRSFNQQVENYTDYSVSSIINREKIDVSFKEFILVANLGDQTVHISAWENLSQKQRDLIKTWFNAINAEEARQYYEFFFYRFFVVGQGAKQFMYESSSVGWVYANRSLYAVERDSTQLSLTYFQNDGTAMALINRGCEQVRRRYDATYRSGFELKRPNADQYFLDNARSLLDPKAPTGYMYYVCGWIKRGMGLLDTMDGELDWLGGLSKD